MNEYAIKIYQKNWSTVSIQCNNTISKELGAYFSAMAPNYRFAPLYKSGMWDGRIKFFSASNELGIGLIEKVYEFARKGNYSINCEFDRFNDIDKNEFVKFVEHLKIPFDIRPYQMEAAYQALCKKHMSIQISTAGGKSLVIYIIVRFLQMKGLKTLIIVPNSQLTEQLKGDFISYGWNADDYCKTIYSGQVKNFDSPVTLSTWQSIEAFKKSKNGNELLSKFDAVIVDESHGAKAQSLQAILKSCINASYRFGFSGTYPEPSIADWFSIVGSIGPIQTFANYKQLQEEGYISQIKIFTLLLNYNKSLKLQMYNECKKDYQKENDFIYGNEGRNKFILKMTQNIKENCLVLFTKKEKHGYILKELLERELKDKIVLYIDGDVDVSLRDDIRLTMEKNNNVILLATYGTLSVGWNVKNLHNIIFASGYKSRTRVLQSIGRGLRLHGDKEFLKLYDLVDNLSFKSTKDDIRYINFSMKHYKERKKFYEEQSWDVKEIKFDLI